MTRTEAIKICKQVRKYFKGGKLAIDDTDAIYGALTMAIEALSAQQWIPIEERPPEFGKDVLISHNGVVSVDWLSSSEGNVYFWKSGVAIQDIEAWMPLPEPYKGE